MLQMLFYVAFLADNVELMHVNLWYSVIAANTSMFLLTAYDCEYYNQGGNYLFSIFA